MTKTWTKKLFLGILSIVTLVGGAFGLTEVSTNSVKTVNAASTVGINTPISWTATAFGATNNVALDSNIEDEDAYGGEAAYKATISSSSQTTGVKITFSQEVDLSAYAHVFVRWKNYNSTSASTSTLRVGVDAEPQAGTQAYPFYDATTGNGNVGAMYYDTYFSYDIKDMVADSVTTVTSLYIGRTGGDIANGAIDLYIDHIDFVENALKLSNVTSFKNVGKNQTYDVSSVDRYSNAAILGTNGGNDAVSAWQGWDIDIYTGKYAFVGRFGVSTNGTFDTRALTLNFDNIDLTQYASVKVKMKNFNTDSAFSTNCTAFLKLNGDFWTSEQSQNNGGGIPKVDWNLNAVANTGHTEEQMRTTYFEYDLLTMTNYSNSLSSVTVCRGNNVNGNKKGIIVQIESIEFIPYVEQKIDTLKLGKQYQLQELFSLADSISGEVDDLSLEGYLNTATPTGTPKNFGSFTSGSLGIEGANYNTSEKTFSVCVAVNGVDTATGKTGYTTFTFKVDASLGIIYTNFPLIVGMDIDLALLFNTEGLISSKECTVNGALVSGDTYKATQKGDYTVNYKISNDSGSEELTTTVKAVDFALQSEITDSFEKEEIEIFADPALPFDGIQYTTKLYKATDDVATAVPITTNSSYIFTESGEYKLVYDINFVTVNKNVTFVTNYNVTLVEQEPTITLAEDLQDTYYTGMNLVLPTATAANSYDDYAVEIGVKNGANDVPVNNGKIVLTEPGEYVVTYSATYDTNRVTEKILTFTVLTDAEAPELLIYGAYEEHYEAGTTITVLTAKVVDDSNEPIDVEITIFKDGTTVEAQNGNLVLEDGSYTIVYKATDSAGHTTERTLSFTAATDGAANKNGGNGSGCNGCSGSIYGIGGQYCLMLLALVSVGLFVVRKKEKNDD